MSGRLKKIIWLVFMAELVVVHLAVLGKMYIHGNVVIIGILSVGFLGMLIYQYCGYRALIKECVETIEMIEDEKTNKLFVEAASETGSVDSKTRVYESFLMKTPFVMGVLRPAIILPEYCKTQTNLKLILLHECFHVKRGDTRYKLFMLIANCFLWFHPLAYFIRYASYQDIEISCDEAVINGKTKEERLAYGQFLIDSARDMDGKGNSFSAYWNSSKKILKNRIEAVMNESRRWDALAKSVIFILVLQVICSGLFFLRKIQTDYNQMNAPVNEFEGAITPYIYNDIAIQAMLSIDPWMSANYGDEAINKNDLLYPEKKFSEMTVQPESPWQIRINRPAMFREAAETALQRLYFYLENQTAYSTENYEKEPYWSNFEIVYEEKLAGDIDNSVWGIIWKVYSSDGENSEGVKKGYAFSLENENNYLYYTTAVQIRMKEPYLFEIVGYADLYKVIDACQQKYGAEYKYYFPELSTNVKSQELELDDQKNLANAFAESKNMWDVRISFPENENEGYLLATIDKAMMQVYSGLYYTRDGGKSWMQIEMDSVGAEHSAVYDFSFVNNSDGFMAIHSFYENPPELLRTQDGGRTWERVRFTQEWKDYCQAFTPIWNGEKYVVYVGKEGCVRDKGEKACYESSDGGRTWDYTGQVIFA